MNKFLFVLTTENKTLEQLSFIDRMVFRYLAEHTDYENGIIGGLGFLSYQNIAFDLTERPPQPRRAKNTLLTVQSDEVKESILELERVGLILILSDSKGLKLSRLHYLRSCSDERTQEDLNDLLEIRRLISLLHQ